MGLSFDKNVVSNTWKPRVYFIHIRTLKPRWLAHDHLQYHDLMAKGSASLFPSVASSTIYWQGTGDQTWHKPLTAETVLCLQNTALCLCMFVNNFLSSLWSPPAAAWVCPPPWRHSQSNCQPMPAARLPRASPQPPFRAHNLLQHKNRRRARKGHSAL